EVLAGVIVIREEPRVELAKGYGYGSGECCRVDEVRCAELLCIGQAVGEDEATFGVGVDDVDGLAGHGGEDVGWLVGLAGWHVLSGADDGEDLDRWLELGDGAHGSNHGRASGHVVLHLLHVVGRLDGDAASVKGNAFADEAEDWAVSGRI